MKTLLIAGAHESAGRLDQGILDFASGRPDLEAIAKAMPSADLDALIESTTSFGENTVRRVVKALGLPAGLVDFLFGAFPAPEIEGARVHFARGVSNAIGRSMDIMLSNPESRAQPLWNTYRLAAVERSGLVHTLASAEAVVEAALLTLAARSEAPRSRWLKCGGFIGALLLVDSVAEVSLSSYLHRHHQDKE